MIKLICVSGGDGSSAAEAVVLAAGLPHTLHRCESAARAGAVQTVGTLLKTKPNAMLFFGETGLSAGLFALKKIKKAQIPAFALVGLPLPEPAVLARFDAVFAADETALAALLQTPIPAYKLFGFSSAAVTLAYERFLLHGRTELVISGSNGLGNLGDEAMLTAILAQLRRIAPQRRITVLSRDCAQTRAAHAVDALPAFALGKLWRRLRKTKLFLSGGGTLLTDLTSTRSLLYYLTVIRLAHHCGANVVLYSCGIGPFADERNKRRVARGLNRWADRIVVRDSDSAATLAAIGVTKPQIVLARDAAFLLDPTAFSSECARLPELAGCGRYAVFALRPWNADESTVTEICAAARRLWQEHGLTSVFLAMEPPKDLPLARTVAAALDTPHVVLDSVEAFAQAFAAIRGAALVVSMRLHAMIAANLAAVPTVGISYDVKISSFLRDTENPHCLEYAAWTADELCAAAVSAMAAPPALSPVDAAEADALLCDLL